MNGFLQSIGPSSFLWPVGILGIIALAIALERFFFLRLRATVATDDFLAEVQKLVLSGTIDPAIRLCLGNPQAPVANTIRAALLHVDASREDLVLAVEQAAADAVPRVQLRIGYLATIANVATLMGLLGTIVGLIQSFDAVSHAEPAQRQALLAGGIALAMRTTAGGIFVAIPCLLAYSYLAQAANAILDDVDRAGMRIVMLLVSRRKGSPDLGVAEEAAEKVALDGGG
jgi:biopolymer transport protein ExbB